MGSKLTATISSLTAVNPQLFMLLFLQYVITLLFPSAYSFLPTVLLLFGTLLIQKSTPSTFKPENYLRDVRMGRWTAQPGLVERRDDEEDAGTRKLAQEGVVCFVIAASINQYASFF